jgi:hypothetical protein
MLALAGLFLSSQPLRAQDTTNNGVRLGLNYDAGTKPGVIVLPVIDDETDSLRVIVQRDLDFSDRMNVIDLDHSTLMGLVPAAGEKINLGLVAKFGAALLVRMTPNSQGLPCRNDVARDSCCSPSISRSTGATGIGVSCARNSDQIEQWFGKRTQTRIAYVSNVSSRSRQRRR